MDKDELRTIVCVGDSTTSQEWCHPSWFDWLDFSLRQKDGYDNGWKSKLINSGKDGGTVPFFLDNFDFLIKRFQPSQVILSLGFNHLELDDDVEELTKELVLKIKSIKSEVFLWSTYKTVNNEVNLKLERVRNLYKVLAKELKSGFVDIFEEFSKYDLEKVFTYKSGWKNEKWNIREGDLDFLHCNLIGNQIIAEKMIGDIFDAELEDWGDFGTMKRVDLRKYLGDTVTR